MSKYFLGLVLSIISFQAAALSVASGSPSGTGGSSDPGSVTGPSTPKPPTPPKQPDGFQSSCGAMKNLINVSSSPAQNIPILMAERNISYEMLRKAQNRIYELSFRLQRISVNDATQQTSFNNEISCLKEVAQAAQSKFDSASQSISKLLSEPINPPKPIVNEPPKPPVMLPPVAVDPTRPIQPVAPDAQNTRAPASSTGGGGPGVDRPPAGGVHANK